MKRFVWGDEPDALVEVESKTLDRLSLARETEHHVFRFAPGSPAAREIEDIAAEQEGDYARLADLFGFELPQKVEYFLTDSPGENGAILQELFGMEPCPTNGLSIGPNYVLGAYGDGVRAIGAHEVAHLFSYRLCMPKCELLSEGLAMYADGAFWGKPNRQWVREFLQDGRYIPLVELISDEGFYAHPSEITYPIAGTFVAFLIRTLGEQAFFDRVYTSDLPLLENLTALLGPGVEERFQAYAREGEI